MVGGIAPLVPWEGRWICLSAVLLGWSVCVLLQMSCDLGVCDDAVRHMGRMKAGGLFWDEVQS